jgi:CheY-like chemotaxis protein
LLLFSPFERRALGESILKDFDGWLVKPVRLESVAAKLVYLGQRKADEDKRSSAGSLFPSLVGQSILVAEDNDVNALLVERQLSKLGAHVQRARDGMSAIQFVQDSFDGKTPPFAAVLMDLRMPNLDGLSAAKAIRAIEHAQMRKPVPIIALTANAFDDDREAAILAGMQAFLTKPIDFSALAQMLEKIDGQSEPSTA